MKLKSIELSGFKSFAKKTELTFGSSVTAIVGPNGSGKSNIAESFRFVLGEQSMKSMRGKRGEDLIWNGSMNLARAGRASVRLVFDNTDRALNLDFDDVILERVVNRDGGNEYYLNNSPVRLRDIAELLSQAGIGASGHHIISQGEADRALSASPRERREMIEDALGLKSFIYRRAEAEKKLEKAAENMREVESLRRELSPHLKFLERQAKKIEESEQLRQEVRTLYREYLAREVRYLKVTSARLGRERMEPSREKTELDVTIERLRQEVGAKKDDAQSRELVHLEEEGRALRGRRESQSRELGRIEGEVAAHERLVRERAEVMVKISDVNSFIDEIVAALGGALEGEFSALRRAAEKVIESARGFAARATGASAEEDTFPAEVAARKQAVEEELRALRAQEDEVSRKVAELRARIEGEKDASRDTERALFAAMSRRTQLEGTLARLAGQHEVLAREKQAFEDAVREAGMLLGSAAFEYEQYQPLSEMELPLSDEDIAHEPRTAQDERRRTLERKRIRLEESGAGNAEDVMKEFRETTERFQFLTREIDDINATMASLRELIEELSETLRTRFSEGIETISKQFDEFFKIMFGGGTASLTVVRTDLRRAASEDEDEEEENKEKEEVQEGVEIGVSLPMKRLKGLHMLSGGERALTSIALIFAMSQVNPPPFLILDETDAALDEANSRRYGDMIETLAKRSQLLLITHNRETMSRAGILYGVTMGSDGASKLLSVKFEEAVAVAK